MTYIDTDHDVIPAVAERPAVPVIRDPIALDDWLAAEQDRASRAVSFSEQGKAYMAGIHGEATDLRDLIAPWVESARENAARTAEEERADTTGFADYD